MLSQQRWKSPQSPCLFDGKQIVLRLVVPFAGVADYESLLDEKSRYVEGLSVGSSIRDAYHQEFRRVK